MKYYLFGEPGILLMRAELAAGLPGIRAMSQARSPVPVDAPRGAAAVLLALRDGDPIAARTAVVVAHADDETLGLGARLATFPDLRLVHLTDGAPRDMTDAHKAGCGDRAAYAALRAEELEAALQALGVRAWRCSLGVADQEVALGLADAARAVTGALAGCRLVLTHAYEGGHPDHDGAAFVVQAACGQLAKAGLDPPLRLEFAGYHSSQGARTAGCFWPDPGRPETPAAIADERLAAKRRAIACYRSQAAVIEDVDPAVEVYRQAPDYDFAALPPPRVALYDTFGWPMTCSRWRARALLALIELEETGPWS